MDRLVIKGKADLKGSIKIKGSKNSALPIMVSALLSKNTLKLKNLPKLDDINNMSKLLRSYGAIIKTSKDNLDTFIRSKNNTEQIGDVLYTEYFIDFQLSGIVLLLAMIGAIVLTHVYRPTIKRQNIESQNSTTAEDRVKLVKIKSGEGIKDD